MILFSCIFKMAAELLRICTKIRKNPYGQKYEQMLFIAYVLVLFRRLPERTAVTELQR